MQTVAEYVQEQYAKEQSQLEQLLALANQRQTEQLQAEIIGESIAWMRGVVAGVAMTLFSLLCFWGIWHVSMWVWRTL